jgi:hypothetical protein
MTTSRIACVLAATIFAGCGGGSADDEGGEQSVGAGESSGSENTVVADPEPTPPPAPSPARVRVLHLAVGAAEATVNVIAGSVDAPVGQVSDVAFKVPSAYAEVPMTGQTMEVPVNVTSGSVQATFSAPVRAGVPATLIVVSNPEDPTQLVVTATEDEAAAVTGQLRGRFLNAIVDVPAVDFCLPGERPRDPGRPIFTNVAYGQVAGTETPAHYIPVSLAGGGTLQVRASAETGCTGRVIGSAEVPPPDGSTPHNLTIAVVGRMRGRPAVARELLVCEDAPGQSACSAIPLR